MISLVLSLTFSAFWLPRGEFLPSQISSITEKQQNDEQRISYHHYWWLQLWLHQIHHHISRRDPVSAGIRKPKPIAAPIHTSVNSQCCLERHMPVHNLSQIHRFNSSSECIDTHSFHISAINRLQYIQAMAVIRNRPARLL